MLWGDTGEWAWSVMGGWGRLLRGAGFGWSFESHGPGNPGGGNGAFKGWEIRESVV